MKLGSGNHLGQLLHIRRLDVDNIKALVLNVEIPQVDSQVIAADECLPVAVDGHAVDVVGVGVSICLSRHGRHDGIMVCKSRKFEVGMGAELNVGVSNGPACSRDASAGC